MHVYEMVRSKGAYQSIGANAQAQDVENVFSLNTLTLAFNGIGFHKGINLWVRLNVLFLLEPPQFIQFSCRKAETNLGAVGLSFLITSTGVLHSDAVYNRLTLGACVGYKLRRGGDRYHEP